MNSPMGPSKQIAFVKLDPGFNKQPPVFFLEGYPTVMFFLSLDVLNEPVVITERTRESSIALLPVGKPLEHGILLDPPRGTGLDLLDEIGQADRGMETGEDVKVVLDPIDAIKMAVAVVDDSPDVSKQVGAAALVENRRAVFGREHDVIRNGDVG